MKDHVRTILALLIMLAIGAAGFVGTVLGVAVLIGWFVRVVFWAGGFR